jgi:hypothetical protein
MFGGMPATGAIARTATNVKNGGRTPVAGMVHALTLLLITLFFGKWAALIPLATLAAILVVVSYHMSEWRTFRSELTAPKSDVAVLLTTFSLTVLVDLTVAIEVGMVLAAFLFMRRMAEVTNVSLVTRELADEPENDEDDDPNSVRRRDVPPGVEVFEISGPFFFGAAEQFKDTLGQVAKKPRVLIIRMRGTSWPAAASTMGRSSCLRTCMRSRCSRWCARTCWSSWARRICSAISTMLSTARASIWPCRQYPIPRERFRPWLARHPNPKRQRLLSPPCRVGKSIANLGMAYAASFRVTPASEGTDDRRQSRQAG